MEHLLWENQIIIKEMNKVVMKELIDKAAVVTEINNWIKDARRKYTLTKVQFSLSDRIESLENLLSFIDTLKVKEVQEESVSKNLEEAAFDYTEACKYDGGEKLLCVEHFMEDAKWQYLAKHFYELGLKTQKGE